MSGPSHNTAAAEPDDDPLERTAELPVLELECPPDAWQLATVVANRYVLDEYLGRGRYGEVYAATDRTLSDPLVALQDQVVLHVLSERLCRQTALLRKLEDCYREPHLWSHPNVARLRGFGSHEGRYFFAVERLEGRTLRAMLRNMPAEGLPDREIFRVLREVGDALEYAHEKGVVHGDVRPEKIFVTANGDVKLLDLLPATVPREKPFFIEDRDAATPPAPDRRDDVYGLACVAYELLTGRHPYGRFSPLDAWNARLVAEPVLRLTPGRWGALVRALALEREHRTATVAGFLAELGATRAGVSRSVGETDETVDLDLDSPRLTSDDARAGPLRVPEWSDDEPADEPVVGEDSDAEPWPDAERPLDGAPAAEPEPGPNAEAWPDAAPWPNDDPDATPPADPALDWPADDRAPLGRSEPLWSGGRGAGASPPRRRRGGAFAATALVVIAGGAAAAYLYYPPARLLVDEWAVYLRAQGERLARDAFSNDVVASAGRDARAARGADATEPRGAAGAPRSTPAGLAPVTEPATDTAAPPTTASETAPAAQDDTAALAPPNETAAGTSPDDAAVRATTEQAESSDATRPVAPAAQEAAAEEIASAATPPPLPLATLPEPERLEAVDPPVTVTEQRGIAPVQIRRRGGTLGETSFTWWTTDGTATAEDDYASFGVRVETFAAGEDTHTVYVPIVVDARTEGRESFYVEVRPTDASDAAAETLRIEVVIFD